MSKILPSSQYIIPKWPAPNHVKAAMTTRQGGISQDFYAELNLAGHVGDNPEHVAYNRNQLKKLFNFSNEPLWLNQVHSNHIITSQSYQENIEADGCYTQESQQICTIMDADCMPILLTNSQGTFVMALHAGWRGITAGIIEFGVQTATQFGEDILVWLGPAISKQNYEVGPEVKEKFIITDPNAESAFEYSSTGKWLMDLYHIVKLRLHKLGIQNIYSDKLCTYENKELFYSFRRDQTTGRMAALIWLEK